MKQETKQSLEEIGWNLIVFLGIVIFSAVLVGITDKNPSYQNSAAWDYSKPDTLYVQDKQITSEIKKVGYGGATDVHNELLVHSTDGRMFVVPSTDFRTRYGIIPEHMTSNPNIKFAQPGDTLVVRSNPRKYGWDRGVVENISMQRRGTQR